VLRRQIRKDENNHESADTIKAVHHKKHFMSALINLQIAIVS
jgi:hypothetical protein